MPGATIESHVFVVGGSIVTHDVPDHCMVAAPRTIKRKVTIISDEGQIITKGDIFNEV